VLLANRNHIDLLAPQPLEETARMAATAKGGALTPEEARITGWLAGQQPAMLRLLEEVVNIDSGSYDKAGVDAVGERFIRFFEGEGLLVEVERHDAYGDAIHVRLDDAPSNE
jgi:hypothetical protein